MKLKRAISITLTLCILFSTSIAEENDKNIFGQIGDWVGQAWDDSSKWVSQAWEDSSKWVTQAWDDSSKWVSQAWQDSTDWVAGTWSDFTIWVRTITWDNPYSWIRDMVLEEGILAYDSYVSIRNFLSENPDSDKIKENKVYPMSRTI